MENKYDAQAEKFLKDTNTQFDVEFIKHGKHFESDTENRDIFKATLSRNDEQRGELIEESFSFGQSINKSTHFGENPPTAYDVLAVIQKYDPEDFNTFCDEYGYDTDSRAAERTYNAVVEEYQKVENLFGDVMEELRQIQ